MTGPKSGARPVTVESQVEETIRRSEGDESRWPARTTPPVGTIGYTGSYREASGDVVEVSVVSVLEARGPD